MHYTTIRWKLVKCICNFRTILLQNVRIHLIDGKKNHTKTYKIMTPFVFIRNIQSALLIWLACLPNSFQIKHYLIISNHWTKRFVIGMCSKYWYMVTYTISLLGPYSHIKTKKSICLLQDLVNFKQTILCFTYSLITLKNMCNKRILIFV